MSLGHENGSAPCGSLAQALLGRDMDEIALSSDVDFGELSPHTNDLLRQGVVAYRRDFSEAERLFQEALSLAPYELAAYFCLYKVHTYMGNLDRARSVATDGMNEAARQAGWPSDPALWPPQNSAEGPSTRFALFTLKALSFIELKRGKRDVALDHLRTLSVIDPKGTVGWPVIFDLAQGIA
jgi:tetratricopeptide (TPR) repeat protein